MKRIFVDIDIPLQHPTALNCEENDQKHQQYLSQKKIKKIKNMKILILNHRP